MKFAILILSFMTFLVILHQSNLVRPKNLEKTKSIEEFRPRHKVEKGQNKKNIGKKIESRFVDLESVVSKPDSSSILILSKKINSIDNTLKEFNFPHCLENRLLNSKQESRIIALVKQREILKTNLFHLRYQKIKGQLK